MGAPTTWSCFCDDADGRAQHPAECAPKPAPNGAASIELNVYPKGLIDRLVWSAPVTQTVLNISSTSEWLLHRQSFQQDLLLD